MFTYPKREESRKRFPQRTNRNRFPVAGIAAVRHVGPLWIVAGRRPPRTIPVFMVRRMMLPAPAPVNGGFGRPSRTGQ
jgi:hypothetical protein